jgi:predicted PurR-regulated permease PerM
MFFRELKEFLAVLPQNMTYFLDQIEGLAVKIGVSLDYSRTDVLDLVNQHAKEVSVSALKIVTDALKRSAGNFTAIILTVLNVFLIPVFFFYLVSENRYWESVMKALVPKTYHGRITKTYERSLELLKSYMQGQFIACTVLAVLYAVGLFAAGLKFGVLIGIITGALTFIPYVGFSLGLVAGVIVAFSMGQGFGYVAAIITIFMVIQALESFVVTVGLTPLESILILIVFGNLFGFAGMLVAIPTGAILKTVIAEYVAAA